MQDNRLNFRYIVAGVYQLHNRIFNEPIVASVWDSNDCNSDAVEKFLIKQTMGHDHKEESGIRKLYKIYDVIPNIDKGKYPICKSTSNEKLINLIWNETGALVNASYPKMIFDTLLDLEVFAVKKGCSLLYLMYIDKEGDLDWKRLKFEYKFETFFNRKTYRETGIIEDAEY